MKIQEALRKNGKAQREISSDRAAYGEVVESYLVWDNGDHIGYDGLIADDWQPYHEVKEIRPENAGELWEEISDISKYYHTDFRGTLGINFRLAMIGDFRVEIENVIHGKGWMRRFPHVEDDSIERIEIESLEITGIHPPKIMGITSAYRMDLGPRLDGKGVKLILETPKDKP